MRIGVVDLFCGIGGLSYGFKAEGFNILAGVDVDESCRYAFEANIRAKFLSTDIQDLSGREVDRLFRGTKSHYKVLVGCAPCPPFSLYTGRYRKARQRDPRWRLLEEFARIIRVARPDVVSMENVPRIVRHPVFRRFTVDLEAAGYTVTFRKVRADHYGVPQRRARLVLMASRWGEIEFPPETHKGKPLTVRHAIGHLPSIRAGATCSSDRLHASRNVSPTNLTRLKSTAEGRGWQDWSPDIQLACHRRKRGRSFRSVYGRMQWDQPAPVITTQCLGIGNGRFGHPEQNRAISIREAALLQSFPKSFRLVAPSEPVIGAHLARQIGNAVPIKLGRAIARAIKNHLGAL